MNPTVSLIATVRNEIASVGPWLAALDKQTLQPDQIVIVDGGSTDGTLEALVAWARSREAVIVSAPGVSISGGRNLGFDRAIGEVLAITDCGTIAEPDWLERLIAPFTDPAVDVVSGFFVPDVASTWERALAAATLPDVEEIEPATFLPSSRSVAVRATWARAGFSYPEWLDYCEDLVWDLQLRRAGARFAFAPDAVVRFAVRPDARSFWRQYFLYARGDGKAGLFAKRHAVRYGSYLVAAIILTRGRPLEVALLGTAGMVHVRKPVVRLLRRDRAAARSTVDSLRMMPLVVTQMVLGDIAKMAGYPVGVRWRCKRFGRLSPSRDWRRVTDEGALWKLDEFQETEKRPTE